MYLSIYLGGSYPIINSIIKIKTMVRLTEKDSVPRVEDAVERNMRLCTKNLNGEKYKAPLVPLYNDFREKKAKVEAAQKEVNFAQDAVWLYDDVLDNGLRDLNGRAKEFDRNNQGSKTASLLFPKGNVTGIVTLPYNEEPDVAQSIAQKVVSLGEGHELYPFAAKIETAVADCRKALADQVTAIRNLGMTKTDLQLSKIKLIRQYNANYFIAATDVDKDFAEKLFPRLRSSRRKKNNTVTENTEGEA